MKKLLTFLLVLIGLTIIKAQPSSYRGFVTQMAVNVDSSWVVYETNTPGSTFMNRIDWVKINRHMISFRNKRIFFDTLGTKDYSGPISRFLVLTSAGEVKPMSSTNFTLSYSNIPGLATALSSVPSMSNVSNWNAAYSWGNHALAGYLTSYTETDPTVAAYIKAITNTNITNWNTAFSWGNHTGLYYPLASNPAGYLTSVPAQSFASLTGKPTTLSGYGITDAYPLSGNPSGFLTSEVDGSITNEIELPSQTGNAGKVLTTNGSTPSWTTITSTAPTSITTTGVATSTQSGQSFTINVPTPSVTPATSITVQGVITATQSGQSFTLSAPSQTAMTTYTVSRTVNSATFIPSATKNFMVDYTIDIQTSVALLTGASSGTVFLEYSTNGGSTWNEMDRGQNNQALGVSISVSLTSINTVKVTGWFDANTIIRLRPSTGGTGTATFTYVRGKERY